MPRVKTDFRIHEELSILANKVSDLEMQLKEEKKIQAKLKYEVATKDIQLATLAEETKDEIAKFTDTSKSMMQETATIENSYRSRIKTMEDEKIRLEHEIAAFDVIENENKYMHMQLQELTKQFHIDTLQRNGEAEASKQRAFDARMTMELVLRKELQALDANFKQRAVMNLEEEADQARVENTELYAELSRREGLATELISSQQASYEVLQRAIIEHEVMITAADMYEKHIAEMQEMLVHEERKLYRIETNLEEVRARVQPLSSSMQSRREGVEKVLEIYDKWETANKKKEKLKRKVLKISRKIVSQVVRDADSVHEAKTKTLAGVEDDDGPADASLGSMSISACQSESLTREIKSEPTKPSARSNTEPPLEEYDPDTAWKASCTPLPNISGNIRTLALKKRTRRAGRNLDWQE